MIRLVLTTVLAWLFLSTAAMAETGLERFEREIKPQIELKSFTYKGAETLGDTGFVLNDVVAVMPASATTGDKDSTLKIDKVTVEALDFERMKNLNDEDMPALRQDQAGGHERRRGHVRRCSIPTASRGCRWTWCSTTASTVPRRCSR